jgi:hypothetical protein
MNAIDCPQKASLGCFDVPIIPNGMLVWNDSPPHWRAYVREVTVDGTESRIETWS